MRAKKYLFSTLKENPKHTDSISHKLMLRSGMIRQNSSGIYTWLPTGLRILKNVCKIIRTEIKKIHALEITMPILQPEFLWNLSNRKKIYGKELFEILDRKNNKFILGPTHEEIITNLIKNELQSYKQLPLLLYQIQTKFRDEIRPRCGVIRSREFIMKDAYSFHINSLSLNNTYNSMYNAYKNIFSNMKLKFHIVEADSNSMGGNQSHEFQALSKSGEDSIALSTKSNYAANIQVATYKTSTNKCQLLKISKKTNVPSTLLHHSNKCRSLKENTIKTILVKLKKNQEHNFVAILIRGDHEINAKKISNIDFISYPVVFASQKEILNITGTTLKFLGPIGLNLPIIADFSVISLKNFTIGSNTTGKYFNNVNWNQHLSIPQSFDIRNAVEGDISPDGMGTLKIKKSIEIGHIFQLGDKYSQTIGAQVQDRTGYKKFLKMGCYGIGITRTIAAIIEQNNDEKGIIWPISITPFQIAIIPINFYKSKIIQNESQIIYQILKNHNITTMLDDRNEHPGAMFSEMELIGIPYSIVISENLIKNNKVEYHNRYDGTKKIISKNEIIQFIIQTIKKY
ncbi:MAG: proline--tRNA ligase [Buchnera aphidicola (Kaburagia rhusicola rhusicola)]